VRPLQLDMVTRGGRRTSCETVRKFQGVGNSTFVLSVERDNRMTTGQDLIEYLDTLGLVKFMNVYYKRKRERLKV
jgi:hypothetical protein